MCVWKNTASASLEQEDLLSCLTATNTGKLLRRSVRVNPGFPGWIDELGLSNCMARVLRQASAGWTGAERQGFTPTDLALLCAQYQEVSHSRGADGAN